MLFLEIFSFLQNFYLLYHYNQIFLMHLFLILLYLLNLLLIYLLDFLYILVLPNNLLFLLSERRIVVPETQQTIACEPGKMPIIVITSNHEQDLPAPFIRRCIYMYIEFPPPERMREIVRMHHP